MTKVSDFLGQLAISLARTSPAFAPIPATPPVVLNAKTGAPNGLATADSAIGHGQGDPYRTLAAAIGRLVSVTEAGAAELARAADRGEDLVIAQSDEAPSKLDILNRVLAIELDDLSVASPGTLDALSRIPSLSMRELSVLELLGQGYNNRDIAQMLALSERTVKRHVSEILRELGVESRLQAALVMQLTRVVLNMELNRDSKPVFVDQSSA